MQRRTLRVALFGLDPLYTTDLVSENIAWGESPCEYAIFDSLDLDAYSSSDIVIFSPSVLDDPASLQELEPYNQKRTEIHGDKAGIIVAIPLPEHISQWTEEDFLYIDTAWKLPMSSVEWTFHLRRSIVEIDGTINARWWNSVFNTAINMVPDIFWLKNRKDIYLKVNDAFANLIGKSDEINTEELTTDPFLLNLPPESTVEQSKMYSYSDEVTINAGCVCSFVEQIMTTEGKRQFKINKAPLYNDEGNAVGIIGVGEDVTDFGNVTTRLSFLLEALPFAAVIEDANQHVTNINQYTSLYFDMPAEEIIGADVATIHNMLFHEPLHEDQEKGEERVFSLTNNQGKRILQLIKNPIHDIFNNYVGAVSIFVDITKEVKAQQSIIEAAYTDVLTGLYNRRYFYEKLTPFINERVALIIFDLDDFKSINDHFGHAAGDAALILASQLIRNAFPEGIPIRWGGDEFMVAFTGNQTVTEIRARANELVQGFPATSQQMGMAWTLKGSAGIAVVDKMEDIDELVRRADDALYLSKMAGKGRSYVYRERDGHLSTEDAVAQTHSNTSEENRSE